MSTHSHDEEVTYRVVEKVEHMFLREHPQALQEYKQVIQEFWDKYNVHLLKYVDTLGK